MPRGQKPMQGAGPLPKDVTGKVPAWLRRALKKGTPLHKESGAIHTRSTEIDGKEILYPTVRIINGKAVDLTKEAGNTKDFDVALEYAKRKKDYIVVEGGPRAATLLSRRLSKKVGRVQGSND